jgi:hypothetical protein
MHVFKQDVVGFHQQTTQHTLTVSSAHLLLHCCMPPLKCRRTTLHRAAWLHLLCRSRNTAWACTVLLCCTLGSAGRTQLRQRAPQQTREDTLWRKQRVGNMRKGLMMMMRQACVSTRFCSAVCRARPPWRCQCACLPQQEGGAPLAAALQLHARRLRVRAPPPAPPAQSVEVDGGVYSAQAAAGRGNLQMHSVQARQSQGCAACCDQPARDCRAAGVHPWQGQVRGY